MFGHLLPKFVPSPSAKNSEGIQTFHFNYVVLGAGAAINTNIWTASFQNRTSLRAISWTAYVADAVTGLFIRYCPSTFRLVVPSSSYPLYNPATRFNLVAGVTDVYSYWLGLQSSQQTITYLYTRDELDISAGLVVTGNFETLEVIGVAERVRMFMELSIYI